MDVCCKPALDQFAQRNQEAVPIRSTNSHPERSTDRNHYPGSPMTKLELDNSTREIYRVSRQNGGAAPVELSGIYYRNIQRPPLTNYGAGQI
ncbi:hypothetical protein G5I_12898 [Acromyrmex echinatior]|uniref:Uncharacterized protein n=1 Tax=Acromyrmex echinatior TaxID=103372 RepID=F4X3K4_ACREC|nr:hypothetical protein G5I_12898 [Acromyrmex echinatior]